MSAKKGDVALIISGGDANLGKLVYVVGSPTDDRLPLLGGGGTPRWQVQMLAANLIDAEGEEFVGGSVPDSGLVSIGIDGEAARALREGAIVKFMERAMTEMAEEEADEALTDRSILPSGPCYFVTSLANKSAVLKEAFPCEIPSWCAEKLKTKGFPEPVPFSVLKGKYWWCRVDVAVSRPHIEPGNGTTDEVASTEEIAYVLRSHYYVKVMAGPFDSREEGRYALDLKWEAPK